MESPQSEKTFGKLFGRHEPSRVLWAISDPTWREILGRLLRCSEPVADLAEAPLSFPTVSKHRKVLQLGGPRHTGPHGREHSMYLMAEPLRGVAG